MPGNQPIAHKHESRQPARLASAWISTLFDYGHLTTWQVMLK